MRAHIYLLDLVQLMYHNWAMDTGPSHRKKAYEVGPSTLVQFAMLLILHTCNSYILLTANMEDIRALAKQLAASPVVDQAKRIWRRASIQFKKELNNRRRGGETDEEDEGEIDTERRTRRVIRDLVALGKESGYLEPIKQLLEKI